MSLKKLFERAFISAPSNHAGVSDAQLSATVLLVEIAQADHDLADSERAMVERGVGQVFALDATQVSDVVARAEQVQASSTSMQPYINAVNQQCTREQKRTLLEALWAVAWADEQLDAHEEHMLRRISDLLFLAHADFIQAKLKITRA